MSAVLVSAVFLRGPKDESQRALVALAHNADDFGFATMRLETIGAHINREAKQVGRYIKKLAAEGWICPVKKAVDGCGNVYFLNLSKLGAGPSEKSRKSPLHLDFLASRGTKWKGATFAQACSGNTPLPNGHSTGGQRTSGGGPTDMGDPDNGHLGLPNKEAQLVLSSFTSPVDKSRDGDDDEEFSFDRSVGTLARKFALRAGGCHGHARRAMRYRH